jgi:uncharacterized protein (TIRG00374 family)
LKTREFLGTKLKYLGLVGFAVLVYLVGPDNILHVLKQANPAYVLVAIIINVPLVALKALRWHLLMRAVDLNFPFSSAFRVYFASLFVGFLTPGRLGEFVKAAYVSTKTGDSLARTLPTVLIDRLFDLYLLMTLGLLGGLRFGLLEGREELWAAVVLAVLVLTLPLSGMIPKILKRFRNSGWAVRLEGKRGEAILKLIEQLTLPSPYVFLSCLLLTALAYLIFFLQCQIGAWAVGLHISFADMVRVMAVTSLLSLIPISVSGIGVRDVSLIVLLGKLDSGSAQAIAFSMMVLIISYVGGGLIGAVCWFLDPIKIRGVSGFSRGARSESVDRE